jgi:hypothetical protein
MLILFSLLLACGEKNDSAHDSVAEMICPTVEEDSCMTEELYQECISCEGELFIGESCPYSINCQ